MKTVDYKNSWEKRIRARARLKPAGCSFLKGSASPFENVRFHLVSSARVLLFSSLKNFYSPPFSFLLGRPLVYAIRWGISIVDYRIFRGSKLLGWTTVHNWVSSVDHRRPNLGPPCVHEGSHWWYSWVNIELSGNRSSISIFMDHRFGFYL